MPPKEYVSLLSNNTRMIWILPVLFLLLAPVTGIFAQETEEPETPPAEEEQFEPTYTRGDQLISLNLGLMVPLFYFGGPDGAQSANLSLGGTGHLLWSSFLNNNLAIGGEFGGMFAFTPNHNTLFMIPLAARVSYFLRSYPFEFPLTLAAGVNFSRFGDNFKTDPIVIPGVGFYWNYTVEWAFGFDVRYWFVPQIYRGPEPPSEDTRVGNFLATTLSVFYRF